MMGSSPRPNRIVYLETVDGWQYRAEENYRIEPTGPGYEIEGQLGYLVTKPGNRRHIIPEGRVKVVTVWIQQT